MRMKLGKRTTKIREGIDREKLQKGLEELRMARVDQGIMLSEIAGAWQLRTVPETAEYVRRFLKVKPQRLTRAAVETLALIAYRQPVTRPEIEDVRGVDSGAVLKALLDRRLIKIVGKKAEEAHVGIRGIREELKDMILKMEKEKEISEDERFRLQEALETVVKGWNEKIRELAAEKEQEIMTI